MARCYAPPPPMGPRLHGSINAPPPPPKKLVTWGTDFGRRLNKARGVLFLGCCILFSPVIQFSFSVGCMESMPHLLQS